MLDWQRELTTRLEPLHLRPEIEAEIVEELAQHLDDRVHELLAGGATPDTARAVALADLDAPGELPRRLAEIVARPRLQLPPPGAPSRTRWLQARWQDFRYALRALRRAPSFTAAVLITLGLTIGPTTAMLSIGNWLLWRPTPGVVEQGRLGVVSFQQQTPQMAIVSTLSYLNLDDLRRGSRSAAAISGNLETYANVAAGPLLPQQARAAFVTADYFQTMGVRIPTGRSFGPDEDQWPLGAHVVVIGDGLAQRAFGGADEALGQRVLINGQPMTVIGVAPREFTGVGPFSRVSVWSPGAAYGYVNHYTLPASRKDGVFSSFIIRLAPSATLEAAKAELDVRLAALVERYPDENGGLAKVRAIVSSDLSLRSGERERYSSRVGVLMTIGVVLLLLGCANVANLMMVRGIRGQRERGVRLALGASRSRLVWMQLTESVVLAAGGAAVGVALAVGLKELVAQLFVPSVATWTDFAVPLDGRVLATTLGVSVVCGLVAGVVPAIVSGRTRLAAAMSHGGGRTATGARRLRSGLAVVQLALSLALITGAFMLMTTLRNVLNNDLGFDPASVSLHKLDATRHGYSEERSLSYYRDVFLHLRATPGWTAVSLSATAFGSNRAMRIQDPTGDPQARLRVLANAVSGAFFDVLGIRTIGGRVFTDDEALVPPASSPPIVVVNQTLARRAFGDTNPVGRQLVLAQTSSDSGTAVTVIGVTTDARWSLTGDPPLEMYFPLTSASFDIDSAVLMVRTSESLRRVTDRIERIAMAADPTLPVQYSMPLRFELDFRLADRITFAWVLSMLGGLGFVLAAVGLYGLLAQSVAERTREFGIRMAIGSGRRHIFSLVLRQAAWIGAIGTTAGICLALWGSQLIEAQLFGVTRWAAGAYAAAAGALLAVVFLAGLWPARTATRIEPVDALRVE